MGMMLPSIALITAETRLAGLLQSFGTKGLAKFRMKVAREQYQRHSSATATFDAEADFERYVEEDELYTSVIKNLRSELDGLGYPVVVVPKAYLANYYFGVTEAVVVVGPDGLVANVAKYVGELPIIGVNPMPTRYDGVLLPFKASEARSVLIKTIEHRVPIKRATLARVQLSDGQEMLAFNDFFVGRQSHVSARYVIYSGNRSESHSSSGVIISTGAGSTGWLSSVHNMTVGIAKSLGINTDQHAKPLTMPWDSPELRWVVREPFRSRTSQVNMVTGAINNSDNLRIESLMPDGGVIFSDGIESDRLSFDSGAIAEFSVASVQSRLVIRG